MEKNPHYSVFQIADWFLSQVNFEAGDALTPLKLQKLVYYAQAWNLAIHGRPLFPQQIQAWAHGPVVPELYYKYRHQRWNAIEPLTEEPDIEPGVRDVLLDVLDTYGDHGAAYLEKLTHSEPPWKLARGNLSPEQKSQAVISHASMIEFYGSLYEQEAGEKS